MEEQQPGEVKILFRHHSPFLLQEEPLLVGGTHLLFLPMRLVSLLPLDLSVLKCIYIVVLHEIIIIGTERSKMKMAFL